MIPPAALPLHVRNLPMLQYAITDRRFFPGDERQKRDALIRQAGALASSKVDYLQLREKDLPEDNLFSLACDLRAVLSRGSKPQLLLNGRAELAAQAGADGVHLPGGWATKDLFAARTIFLNTGRVLPILSVSAHTLSEVETACVAGANLILFGPIFEKRVRGERVLPGVGLEALAEVVRTAGGTPLLALGGLTAANIEGCIDVGAAGIAAIRFFLPPAPPDGSLPDMRN